MAIVYCLQHTEYVDRKTGVLFDGIDKPFIARTETDDLGRTTKYTASSRAEVSDPDHVAYFKARPWMFHVVESRKPESSAVHEVKHRAGPWHDVVDPDGELVNDKALTRDDAQALADELNGSD